MPYLPSMSPIPHLDMSLASLDLSLSYAVAVLGTRITITSRDLEGDSDEEIEMRGPIDYRTDDNNTRNGEFYQPPVDEMEESGPYDPYDIEDSDEDDEH